MFNELVLVASIKDKLDQEYSRDIQTSYLVKYGAALYGPQGELRKELSMQGW